MDQEVDKLDDVEADTAVDQTSAPSPEIAADTTGAPAETDAQAAQPADAAPDTKAGSLTPPNSETNKPTEQAQPPPQQNWEKRYADLMSHTSKQTNEWRTRMQETERKNQELANWKQEQEKRAQAAQLKPWSKAHPEFQKFNGVLERAKVIDKQLRSIPANLPPEQQEAMKQAIVGALSNEEQQQIGEYRDSLTNFQRDFFTDPHGTILPMVEQLAEQKVQQALQKIEAQHSVQQDFADPVLAPMLKEHGQDFARALNEMRDPNKTYDYAKQMMMLYAENQRLKSQSQQVDTRATMAEEQKRLAKGEAAITRDTRAPKIDPYESAKVEAAKRGIPLDSPRFSQLLTKHQG
jgi:hypothetical protein